MLLSKVIFLIYLCVNLYVYQRKASLHVRFEVVTKVTANITSFWFVTPCAQDRDRWRGLVNTVMNLEVPYTAGNFLTG